ncbi:MAG: zinc ribbon domain-containing protein, partial [Acidimicrobiia bacterium]|nr:zinc ribbon domain-containing protein [Acidimicrobiia bacterium]
MRRPVECAQCGAANRDGARFCSGCGSDLAPKCSGCGADLGPNARFCDQCGTPVTGSTSAPPVAPASTP